MYIVGAKVGMRSRATLGLLLQSRPTVGVPGILRYFKLVHSFTDTLDQWRLAFDPFRVAYGCHDASNRSVTRLLWSLSVSSLTFREAVVASTEVGASWVPQLLAAVVSFALPTVTTAPVARGTVVDAGHLCSHHCPIRHPDN